MTKEGVLKLAQEKDVKFVGLWFSDILGQLKSFTIPKEELQKALSEGMGFDGSSIKGFARIDESDMIAKPDPAAFMPKPIFGVNGSGMNTHQSLFEDGTNVFFDGADKYYLSRLAKGFG